LSRQPHFEGVLRDHYLGLGGMVGRACELADLRQDSESVIANVMHHTTGKTEEIRASYLVGCDGGHSNARKLLGLSFEGEATTQHFVLADAEVEWDLDPAADVAYWFLHPDGMLLASTYGDAPMWSLFAQMAPMRSPPRPSSSVG
jgi:2-polyprenyl-6-methoxyphenol hydroxylase-like FAD-dependent oxidoreductase